MHKHIESSPDYKRFDVFISYSFADKAAVLEIIRDLEQAGIECWYAKRYTDHVPDWTEANQKALKQIGVALIFYGSPKRSQKSTWRDTEISSLLRLAKDDVNRQIANVMIKGCTSRSEIKPFAEGRKEFDLRKYPKGQAELIKWTKEARSLQRAKGRREKRVVKEHSEKKAEDRIKRALDIEADFTTCHVVDKRRGCDLQKPSLAMAAELTRFNEASRETLIVIEKLLAIGNLAKEVVPGIGRGDSSTISDMAALHDKIVELFEVVRSFDRDYNNKKTEKTRLFEIMIHRVKGEGVRGNIREFVDDLMRYRRWYDGKGGASNPKLLSKGHYAIMLSRSRSIVDLMIEQLAGSMLGSHISIKKAFKDKRFKNIGANLEKARARLSHNSRESASIWRD